MREALLIAAIVAACIAADTVTRVPASTLMPPAIALCETDSECAELCTEVDCDGGPQL